MSQVEPRKQRVWHRRTYIWTLSGLGIISGLIYWEQTALLFVLSTVAMCVLLILVGIADLEGRDKELHKEADSPKAATENNPTKNSSVPVSAASLDRKRQKGAA